METNICEDFIIKKVIIGGEKGDTGPQGPPGEGVSLPIAAADVTVANVGYTTVQDVINALLYITPQITGFITPVTLLENRSSTDSSADFLMNFSWGVNKILASQTLVGPAQMTPVTLTADQVAAVVTLTDFNTSSTFTLTITDTEGGTDVATITVTFTNKIYYGDAAIPGAIDSTFINSLSSKLQATSTTNVQTNTTDYFWFACPVAYGIPNFVAGGFTFAMEAPITIPHTNAYGHTEDYYVFRATNNNLGGLDIEIS